MTVDAEKQAKKAKKAKKKRKAQRQEDLAVQRYHEVVALIKAAKKREKS